ncbi:MAG: hypothetical protein K0S47_3870 [Herbinix sp.]|nr:hypothetical protein [Herbinix sp.]
MRLKAVKTILAICLITIMTLTIVSPISKADGNSADNGSTTQVGAADIKSKNEVVYATLTAKGSINAVYVVNHFEINKGGSITDYGKYKSVLNLTESKPIVVDGDTVTLQADQENYYYQGNMETTDLPWIFDFSYNLDGVELSPQEIAGKTGKLDIHINIDKNENANATFFENYMLQVSLNLNADQCKNIEAPDATVAEAGNNKMLTFTVMPDRGADFQVTTDVNNFTMSGIQISAMPFSMNVDLQDTEDMIEDFNQLPDAIAKLNEGVGKLADGTQKLKNGANDLMNGSSEFKTGLSELKKNSGAITAASGQIKNALSTIASLLI